MPKINITDASDDQVRDFAISLQLNEDGAVTKAKSRADLMAVIGPAWNQDFIFVEAEESALQMEAAVQMADHVKDFGEEFGPLTTFRVMTTEMPGGKHAAAPIVNGKTCKIDRGILVSTNYAFYMALMDARGGVVEQAPDRDGRPGEMLEIDTSNYPLTDVQRPSPTAIAAWRAKYGARELGTLAR